MMRVTRSAGSQKHFINSIKRDYGKGYTISKIITIVDGRSYMVGKYTAVLKERAFLRKLAKKNNWKY